MQLVVSQAQRAAAAGVRVMVTGENGTGKEVLAKHIHKIGARSSKPIIDINCAAIQDTMLESELFGYEATGISPVLMIRRRSGLMEVADTGILFLDEVSSMSMDMQSKLLRAIEEQNFRRVGGTNLVRVDVQIISASNRNLRKMIEDGKFREDLFYRLNVVDLHLPPLAGKKRRYTGIGWILYPQPELPSWNEYSGHHPECPAGIDQLSLAWKYT